MPEKAVQKNVEHVAKMEPKRGPKSIQNSRKTEKRQIEDEATKTSKTNLESR